MGASWRGADAAADERDRNEHVRHEQVREQDYDGVMPSTQPRSRRERPAKPALSREGIVDAALAVLETDGIEKLTMRRLAADLDTGPASLYVYVRSTTEVHAMLIDRLLARLDLSWDGRDWHGRLRSLLVSYAGLLMSHPGLARSALVTWPDGPHYLDLIELMLRLITEGGVPASRAAWGVDVLLQHATAMAAEYGTRGERPEQGEAELADALAGADARRHPILTSLGVDGMMGGERDHRRDWSLDVVINGVVSTPRPTE
jgi:AcrR family transcriptional regulator